MFCQHCGKPLPDGAAFCPACGGGISAPATDYQAQKQAVRDSEIAALRDAIRYFSEKKPQYDRHDAVQERFIHYARGTNNVLIILGAFFLVIGVILIVFFTPLRPSVTDLPILIAQFLTAIPGEAMLVIGIILKIIYRRKYVRYYAEYTQLAEELHEHYLAYDNCPVGQEYTNPAALLALLGILQSGRADTVKDAFDILLVDLNRRRVDEFLTAIEAHVGDVARFISGRFFF